MKVALMVAWRCPCALSGLAFVAPGLYAMKVFGTAAGGGERFPLLCRHGFAYPRVPTVFGFMARIAPDGVAWMTDIEKYLAS